MDKKNKKLLIDLGIIAGVFYVGSIYGKERLAEQLTKNPSRCVELNLPCNQHYQ